MKNIFQAKRRGTSFLLQFMILFDIVYVERFIQMSYRMWALI